VRTTIVPVPRSHCAGHASQRAAARRSASAGTRIRGEGVFLLNTPGVVRSSLFAALPIFLVLGNKGRSKAL
jgi:hypothetical protein